jgi:hypothetical protein
MTMQFDSTQFYSDESVEELRRQFGQALASQRLNPTFAARAASQFNPMLTRYQLFGGPDINQTIPAFSDFVRGSGRTVDESPRRSQEDIMDRLRQIYGYSQPTTPGGAARQFGQETGGLSEAQEAMRDMFSEGRVASSALAEGIGGRGNIFAPYMRAAVRNLFERLGGDTGIAGGTDGGGRTFLEEAQARGLLNWTPS